LVVILVALFVTLIPDPFSFRNLATRLFSVQLFHPPAAYYSLITPAR
jgi:hypothetical protein